jgi:hypothetical protein
VQSRSAGPKWPANCSAIGPARRRPDLRRDPLRSGRPIAPKLRQCDLILEERPFFKFRKRLPKLGLRVHHNWAIPGDGLDERLPRNQ